MNQQDENATGERPKLLLTPETADLRIGERGPLYAVVGAVPAGRVELHTTDNRAAAEQAAAELSLRGLTSVTVYEPAGSSLSADARDQLRKAGQERKAALDELDDRNLKAKTWLRIAIDEGVSEVEAARLLGTARNVVRDWLGKGDAPRAASRRYKAGLRAAARGNGEGAE